MASLYCAPNPKIEMRSEVNVAGNNLFFSWKICCYWKIALKIIILVVKTLPVTPLDDCFIVAVASRLKGV